MKRHFSVILLLAILLQAMIPAGFMPGKASAGSFIQICSTDGLITVEVDHDGQPAKQEQGKSKPCVFSLLPVANIESAPDFFLATFNELPKVITAGDLDFHQQTFFLPPSTAPPTLI